MDAPVVVIGAGGHGRVVASTLLESGRSVAGFYDDDPDIQGQRYLGIPVLGPTSAAADATDIQAVLGVGDNRTRKQLAETLDLDWTIARHPFSWVAPDAEVGPGTVIFAGVIVQTGSSVGAHVILNSKSNVEHDSRVGDYVHVSSAHLAGNASAEEGAFLALGSIILPGVNVGAWATVSAGTVARKDVPPDTTLMGAPTRELYLPRTPSED